MVSYMKYIFPLKSPNFTVENVDIETVSRPKGFKHSYRTGRHKHGFVYTVKGELCDRFGAGDDEVIYAKSGEMVFIPKSCVYIATFLEENTEIIVIHFDISGGELPSYMTAPQKIQSPGVNEFIESFSGTHQKHKSNHPFFYLSCLYKFLWQIDERYSGIPQKFQKLKPALDEINGNFTQNQSVGYYAALCDISEVSFRRLFKEYTGMAPIDYRNDIRLNFAKNKLQSGEYNVSETAELSGFSNLSFFTRLYKKKFGHTPKEK